MNRLREPGDSDYDVLGVSPEATDEDINFAFRELIDGEGYKVGIPLNRQWLRAHQIKAAHAMLADPAKRRTYDESLSQSPSPALWATAANDPATDKLVLPAKEPEAAEPVKNRVTTETVDRRELDGSPLMSSDPELAEDEEPGRKAEESARSKHEELSPQFFAAVDDDSKRLWVRNRRMAAAVASGIGLMLVWFVSEWNRQPSASELAPGITASAGQASGAETGPGYYSAQSLGGPESTAASIFEEPGAPSGDSQAASNASGRPPERQQAGDTSATAGVRELVTTGTGDATRRIAAAGEASPTPTESVEAQATAPVRTPPAARATVIAAPRRLRIAPGYTGAPVRGSLVRTPPRWLGGGPTSADNRRGRYQGTVYVQVNITPAGRVSNCAAVQGSGNRALDSLTCRLVRKRARFAPALDAQGRPVVSQAYTTFVWSSRRR